MITTELTHTITVTPKMLRRIADEMEEQMPHRTVGQNVYSYPFYKGQELTIKLMADQMAYINHVNANNPGGWV